MNGNGGRIQNLRDFTVQIRHTKTEATKGTGIVVSADGKVVTCGHVVVAAGVNPRAGKRIPGTWEFIWKSIFQPKSDTLTEGSHAEVGLYFPQARHNEIKARRATVAACFPDHDDDVVLLQLLDGPPPLGPEQIAVLGRAEESFYHSFRSYGYRRLDRYQAGHAHGTILADVETPTQAILQADPVQLESNQINRGMSGAAVLDVERNLVVGIVSETWYPNHTGKDRDTAWAVNARVLSLEPLNLSLRDQPLKKRPARQPSAVEQEEARQAPPLTFPLQPVFHNAPPSLGSDWAGRADLLQALTHDWTDPDHRVAGLIGFGGEGKSSLARRWLREFPSSSGSQQVRDPRLEQSRPPGHGPGSSEKPPDGIFWWGFYESRSVDAFLEAALTYLGGAELAARVTGAGLRAGILGALLKTGRFLFVLDGLEVMQHQEGDSYGLLISNDLRDFLSYLAAPGHESFCLITSRAPLLDLLDYPAYTHHDVERLSPADARALLRNLGLKGDDAALDQLSQTWDGYALTLSLLGSDIAERYGGDLAQQAGDLPTPESGEGRYERVGRILRRYDEHLTAAERAFLTIFSAFRLPVHESALDGVFRVKPEDAPPPQPSPSEGEGVTATPLPRFGGGVGGGDLTASLAQLADPAFSTLLHRLQTYRLLRYNKYEHHYTTHPLIRNYYAEQLKKADPAELQEIHQHITKHYLALAGDDTPAFPTLDDLTPLIEAVHHTCQARDYDEAFVDIVVERIYQDYRRRVLVNQLGAWETALALMLELFPNGDTTQEPQVSKPSDKSWILNETGLCLMNLGRLAEAVPFYERAVASVVEAEDWHNASSSYQNLAILHADLGELAASADAAREALALARRAEDKQMEIASLGVQAWAAHLHGEGEAAEAAFQQAEVLEREIDSTKRYLYSMRGIQHADHLRRTGHPAYARRVTDANLEICERNRWLQQISQCHRVLGDLDADSGQQTSARQHYDEALKIARGISHRHSLIEALLARGRWAARQGQVRPARNDLEEALGYAVAGGYRIYEADIRVGLAWAHLAAGNPTAAQTEANRARQMSEQMGYYWGQVDAEEVLGKLRGEG